MAGNAQRYLFLFLIGLVTGVIGTVMAMSAIKSRSDRFPESLMQVQQWHLSQLNANIKQNRCGAIDTIPHLQALRTTANDLEKAFPDLADDTRFADSASAFRAALDTSLATPPLNCPGLAAAAGSVEKACKACHQDFRN